MAITTDVNTDIGMVRMLVNDMAGAAFDDNELTAFLLQANGMKPLPVLPTRLTLDRLYWSVHLAWLAKAGILADKAKKQKIAIISKDTYVTFEAAMQMAEVYRKKANASVGVAADGSSLNVTKYPALDTQTPFIDTTDDKFRPISITGEVW